MHFATVVTKEALRYAVERERFSALIHKVGIIHFAHVEGHPLTTFVAQGITSLCSCQRREPAIIYFALLLIKTSSFCLCQR